MCSSRARLFVVTATLLVGVQSVVVAPTATARDATAATPKAPIVWTASRPAPEEPGVTFTEVVPPNMVVLDPVSAKTFTMTPAEGRFVAIAARSKEGDVDLIVSQGDDYLCWGLSDAESEIAFFRAPGGTVVVDIVNPSQKRLTCEVLCGTLLPVSAEVPVARSARWIAPESARRRAGMRNQYVTGISPSSPLRNCCSLWRAGAAE